MASKTKPFPCPCGDKAPYVKKLYSKWYVSCAKCRCLYLFVAEGKTRTGAIRSWNNKVRKAMGD